MRLTGLPGTGGPLPRPYWRVTSIMSWSHVKTALGLSVGGLLPLGAVVLGWAVIERSRDGLLTSSAQAAAAAESPGAPADGEGGEAISVTAVRPRRDPSFSTSVEQPAYVEGYYQADVMARAAGPVKSVVADIGDRVKAGEVLLQLDVPDLMED